MVAVEPELANVGQGLSAGHRPAIAVYGDPLAPAFTPPPVAGGQAGGMRLAP